MADNRGAVSHPIVEGVEVRPANKVYVRRDVISIERSLFTDGPVDPLTTVDLTLGWPALQSCYNRSMDKLIEQRNTPEQRLKVHVLCEEALRRQLDALVERLQAECPHEHTTTTSTYHGGGYDYCAETF